MWVCACGVWCVGARMRARRSAASTFVLSRSRAAATNRRRALFARRARTSQIAQAESGRSKQHQRPATAAAADCSARLRSQRGVGTQRGTAQHARVGDDTKSMKGCWLVAKQCRECPFFMRTRVHAGVWCMCVGVRLRQAVRGGQQWGWDGGSKLRAPRTSFFGGGGGGGRKTHRERERDSAHTKANDAPS